DVCNLFGGSINGDDCVEDGMKGRYSDLKTTVKDAEKIRTPVILFTSENDEAARHESVTQLQTALGARFRGSYILPEPSYRLHENPKRDLAIFREVAACCLEQLYPLSSKGPVREPLPREIARQTRIERERARLQQRMTKSEAVEV